MDGFHKPESRAISSQLQSLPFDSLLLFKIVTSTSPLSPDLVLRENLVRYNAIQYIKENHVENERKNPGTQNNLWGGGGDV